MMIRMIRMAMDQPGILKFGGYRQFVAATLAIRWMGASPNWETRGEAIPAFVNHSNWLVRCPDCPEVLVAQVGEPFYCPECQCVKNGGFARPVLFPNNFRDIERVLLARAMPEHRNWTTETVDELRKENVEQGEETEWLT